MIEVNFWGLEESLAMPFIICDCYRLRSYDVTAIYMYILKIYLYIYCVILIGLCVY